MKLVFLPTLSEMREMLGDQLYVEMVWMWREREQRARALEQRAKWAAEIPARKSEIWPKPVFARVEPPPQEPVDAEPVARLLPGVPRASEPRTVSELEVFLGQIRATDGSERKERVSVAGGRQRR